MRRACRANGARTRSGFQRPAIAVVRFKNSHCTFGKRPRHCEASRRNRSLRAVSGLGRSDSFIADSKCAGYLGHRLDCILGLVGIGIAASATCGLLARLCLLQLRLEDSNLLLEKTDDLNDERTVLCVLRDFHRLCAGYGKRCGESTDCEDECDDCSFHRWLLCEEVRRKENWIGESLSLSPYEEETERHMGNFLTDLRYTPANFTVIMMLCNSARADIVRHIDRTLKAFFTVLAPLVNILHINQCRNELKQEYCGRQTPSHTPDTSRYPYPYFGNPDFRP